MMADPFLVDIPFNACCTSFYRICQSFCRIGLGNLECLSDGGRMYGLSGQGLRRSQITFSSRESTDPIEFRHLKRAREPVSRSKSGVQGKVADTFRSRSRHAES